MFILRGIIEYNLFSFSFLYISYFFLSIHFKVKTKVGFEMHTLSRNCMTAKAQKPNGDDTYNWVSLVFQEYFDYKTTPYRTGAAKLRAGTHILILFSMMSSCLKFLLFLERTERCVESKLNSWLQHQIRNFRYSWKRAVTKFPNRAVHLPYNFTNWIPDSSPDVVGADSDIALGNPL